MAKEEKEQMKSFNKWTIAAAISVSLAGGTAFAQSGGGSGAGSGAGQSGQSGAGAGQSGGMTGDMGPGSGQADRGQGNLQKFAEQAAISNMAEIQLGQLAQQKAQDPEVKQFAQMMVDQHTQAQNQLQQAASTSGISLPTSLDSKHQKIQDKLSNLSGPDFDKEYMKVMVAAHKDTQKLLEKRVGTSNDNNAGSQYGKPGTAGTSGSGAGTSGTGSGMGTSGSGTGSGTSAGTSGAGSSGMTGGTATGTSGQAGTTAESGTGQQGGVIGGATGAVGTSGSATTIDGWAQTVLPQVQQHLREAKDLEKRVKDEGKNSGKNNDKDKGGR